MLLVNVHSIPSAQNNKQLNIAHYSTCVHAYHDEEAKSIHRAAFVSNNAQTCPHSPSCLRGVEPDPIFCCCNTSSSRCDVLCILKCFSKEWLRVRLDFLSAQPDYSPLTSLTIKPFLLWAWMRFVFPQHSVLTLETAVYEHPDIRS